MSLAIYAVKEEESKGRQYQEPGPVDRNEFQRDRDRIIHSSAFRRLEYKTQVFVNHEGDMYRTRLTHSIEVAQIARSISRNLGLNEDLTEAIALAHDLGHTPFGHAGQSALNHCMRDYGGFEHNLQSVRVVDLLEEKYAAFPGLNLCFETREGILKHTSTKIAKKLGELGLRFIHKQQPSLEAQVVDIADAIAYNSHDVDDGLRSGLLQVETLLPSELFRISYERVRHKFTGIKRKVILSETVSDMIHSQITDLVKYSKNNILKHKPNSIYDVRKHDSYLVGFSAVMARQHQGLKKILNSKLYQHPVVGEMSNRADTIVKHLFSHFMHQPDELPIKYQKGDDISAKARLCADYIAGMTDRYATKIYESLIT